MSTGTLRRRYDATYKKPQPQAQEPPKVEEKAEETKGKGKKRSE